MESTTKPAKSSSNISEIVHRFAKVCRLRSIGVFPCENVNHNKDHSTEGSSDATEGTECDEQKIHPHPIDETLVKSDKGAAAAVIPKLLDSISALKLAYIQLQEAHVHFNPEKIQIADDLIVSEMKALSEIKRSFKGKQITKPISDSCLPNSLLLAEIQDHESLLKKLESQIHAKDTVMLQLKRKLEDLDRNNADLKEKFVQKALEEENIGHCRDMTPCSFSDAFKAASKSIHDFAKPLISLMKASGWDLDLAANSIEETVIYSKRSHKKYAFEAYISRRMFHGFCSRPHNVDGITSFKDPFDALMKDPNSAFANFCRLKYPLVVHPKMETTFFGNLDQRNFVLSGRHPRTPFYQVFVKMAKWVWVLQALAASTEPKAEIFGFRRGREFSEDYMDSVVEDEGDAVGIEVEQGRLHVGFMVMPGFRVGQAVVKSRVYVSRMKSSHGDS